MAWSAWAQYCHVDHDLVCCIAAMFVEAEVCGEIMLQIVSIAWSNQSICGGAPEVRVISSIHDAVEAATSNEKMVSNDRLDHVTY